MSMTCRIIRDFQTEFSVTLEAVIDGDGKDKAETGCYTLYEGEHFLGELCFNRDDPFDWEYIGDQLDAEDILQIAGFIQKQRHAD